MQNSNQPSSNKSSSNKLSPFKECTNYDECTKVAVDRLKDAVALLKGKRYIGALYMAGYVIEIGIKAEFYRLAKKKVSFSKDTLEKVVVKITKEDIRKTKKTNIEKWLSSQSYVKTQKLKDWISDLKETVFSDDPPKKAFNEAFSVIIFSRYEQDDKPVHDLKGFFSQLQDWKQLIGEQKFDEDSFDDSIWTWRTTLRYSINSEINLKNSSLEVLEALKVGKAVKDSLSFLKKILVVLQCRDTWFKELNEIEKELEQLEQIDKNAGLKKQDQIDKDAGLMTKK